MVKIEKLIWDEWNIRHIARHDVSVDEVREALSDDKVVYLPTYNDRTLSLGRSGRRLLSIILSEEVKGGYYVVTARDMSEKERKVYRSYE